MEYFVGTSGYSYPPWCGSFYPQKLPQPQMLSYYAQHFRTVELNNTFRRMPSIESMRSWAIQVPTNFRFAIKAPQAITHFKRLKDAEEPTKELFRVAATLKDRLGPILFGLPPNFKKDLPRFKAFLKLLPRKRHVAFEFRHESWFDDEVCDCLRDHRCALCITDAEDLPLAPMVQTADWGYLRLRRKKYTKPALATWLGRIQSLGWNKVYVFFKHEETGTGPKFARQLLKIISSD
jgi:uncharacterized protein YecE (DUF72 family)